MSAPSEENASPPPPPPPPPVAEQSAPPPLADFTSRALTRDDLAPELAPAPFILRILAYLCDWLLGALALYVGLKWFISFYYAEEWAALWEWCTGIAKEYSHALHSAQPFAVFTNSVLPKINAIPNPAKDLIAFIGTVQTVFFWIYFFVTEHFTNGCSLGKKIFHLRTASVSDFGPPRFLDSLMRSGWKSLFFCSQQLILLIVGIIDAHVPLFSATRRAWHDMLTHTIVLDANQSPLEIFEKRRRELEAPNANDDDDF